ncbi:MAG: SBBP repeat-containing protein [Bacteroidetes bacterium]|nr:SBBP repeat-containing protein [Bacteroidota bacterium]
MRKAIFIFYLFYFLVLNTEGQSFEWVKSTGAIVQKAVAVDKFGNVYTTGSFLGTKDFDPGPSVFNLISTGNSDIFVCKLDVNGNFIWAKQIGGSGNDNGNSIVTDTLGDIYLCGEFTSVADFDPGPNSDTLYSAGGQDIFF